MTFSIFILAQKSLGKDIIKNENPSEIIDFKLYPNPVLENTVYITTKSNAAKDIIVYNIFGEVVLRQKLTSKELNITKLVDGMYIIQVTENQKTSTRKLVVK